jgi:putative chitinase
MIDFGVFFSSVRKSIFTNGLTKGQVDGMEKILDYWTAEHSDITLDQMSYILATIYWETAHKMVPVKEAGGERYLRSKRYYPYIGVGLVQVTWSQNWKRWGIGKAEDGLSWPIALRATFEGMLQGAFTGKRLSDYIGNGRRDYVGARRIINGVDRNKEIAAIAEKFRTALREAQSDAPVLAAMSQEQSTPEFRDWLLAALRDDEEVREAILALVYPEEEMSDEPEPDMAYDDEPHEEYGQA